MTIADVQSIGRLFDGETQPQVAKSPSHDVSSEYLLWMLGVGTAPTTGAESRRQRRCELVEPHDVLGARRATGTPDPAHDARGAYGVQGAHRLILPVGDRPG